MKKIVIVTGKSEPDYGFYALLNTLFPDCEIQLVSREINVEDGPEKRPSDPLTAYTRNLV